MGNWWIMKGIAEVVINSKSISFLKEIRVMLFILYEDVKPAEMIYFTIIKHLRCFKSKMDG